MFLARQFKDGMPHLSQERFQCDSILEKGADYGLALLLQLFSQFGETDLALVRPQTGGVGVLVPYKTQERSRQARPYVALHPVRIIARKDI